MSANGMVRPCSVRRTALQPTPIMRWRLPIHLPPLYQPRCRCLRQGWALSECLDGAVSGRTVPLLWQPPDPKRSDRISERPAKGGDVEDRQIRIAPTASPCRWRCWDAKKRDRREALPEPTRHVLSQAERPQPLLIKTEMPRRRRI